MAEGSGGVNGLAFIVGILVVLVAVLAVLYFTGVFGGGGAKVDVNIKKEGAIERPVPPRQTAFRFG